MSSLLITGVTVAGVLYVHSLYESVPWEYSVITVVSAIVLIFLWVKFQSWRKNNYIRLNSSRKISEHHYEVLKKYQTMKEVEKLLKSDYYKAFMDSKLVVKQPIDEEPIEEIVFDDE